MLIFDWFLDRLYYKKLTLFNAKRHCQCILKKGGNLQRILKVEKVKRGFYEATISTITKHPKDYKDYEITDIFLKLLEEQIYEAPEYYLWTHKRWKHRDKVPEKFN